MKCPICNGNQIGKVGTKQYYCWNCFIEFSLNQDGFEVYEIAEDGSLLVNDNLEPFYNL